MTDEEWLRTETTKALQTLGAPKNFNADDLEAYVRQLRGLDRETARTALRTLQDQARFFPRPAELRGCLETVRTANAKSAGGPHRVKGTWDISMIRDEEKQDLAVYAALDWIRDLYDWPDNVGQPPDHSACMMRESDLKRAFAIARGALRTPDQCENGFIAGEVRMASRPYQLKMVGRANKIGQRFGLPPIAFPDEPDAEQTPEAREQIASLIRGGASGQQVREELGA